MRIALIGSGTSAIGFIERIYKKSNVDNIKIDVFEQGEDPFTRKPVGKGSIYGFGGAGTFSDGKLSISPDIGGEIAKYLGIEVYQKYVEDALKLWTLDGKIEDRVEKSAQLDDPRISKIADRFFQNNLSVILSEFVHIGTDNLQKVIKELYKKYIEDSSKRFSFHFKKAVVDLEKSNGKIVLVFDNGEHSEPYDKVVIATGRGGSKFVDSLLKKWNISFTGTKVDLGVRYEVSHRVTKEITDVLYEFKVKFLSRSDDEVRTFCVNPQGFVSKEIGNDFITVNGHSYVNKKSENTNFAILVTHSFTKPFDDPTTYGLSVIKLANKLAGDKGIIIQRYKDFVIGRRSTDSRISKSYIIPTLDATPGDLNLVLPRRTATAIEEFIEALNNVIPGINNPGNFLYGVEAKFYSLKPNFDKPFKLPDTEVYVVGDASGYTRGIMQATMSGMYVADEIIN
ncbi:MAG: uncharacterized protein PWQ20_1509 [Thermotogaceae bacterium]|nr:uncharacterized protein [Thermotogaceae bacterium]MDN5338439.1 uncharacterized protein [Thermotogaceae bacterium]